MRKFHRKMMKNLSKIVKFNVKTSKISSLNVSRKFRHAALRMPNTEHQNEEKIIKFIEKTQNIEKKRDFHVRPQFRLAGV